MLTRQCNVNRLWNFFVVMVTPTLISSLKWKAYLIFMVLNFAFVALIWFVYPETSNRTLEEMDLLFAEGVEGGVAKDMEKAEGVEVVQRVEKKALGRSRIVMRSLTLEVRKRMPRVSDGSTVVGGGDEEGKRGATTYVE